MKAYLRLRYVAERLDDMADGLAEEILCDTDSYIEDLKIEARTLREIAKEISEGQRAPL